VLLPRGSASSRKRALPAGGTVQGPSPAPRAQRRGRPPDPATLPTPPPSQTRAPAHRQVGVTEAHALATCLQTSGRPAEAMSEGDRVSRFDDWTPANIVIEPSPRSAHLRRAALYLRVSTRGQDVAPQRIRLRELCEQRGWAVVAEYVDVASGAKSRRQGLDALLAAAERSTFDVVLAVKLDRIARSVPDLLATAKRLEAADVGLAIADQPEIDTTTSVGRLTFTVLAAVAAFERDLIVERVRAGLKAARRRGVRLGRVERLQGAQLARARRLHDHGHSMRAIARQLGVSRGAVAFAMGRVPSRAKKS